MKKALAVILALVMMLAVSSCGNEEAARVLVDRATETSSLSNAERQYYNAMPGMTASNKVIYNKYIEPYITTELFCTEWSQNDYSNIRDIMRIYLSINSNDKILKSSDGRQDELYPELDQLKNVVSTRLIINKDTVERIWNMRSYSKDDENFEPMKIVFVVTDSQRKDDVLSVYIDGFEKYSEGSKQTTPVLKYQSVLKIKIQSNGNFKFLSNTIINGSRIIYDLKLHPTEEMHYKTVPYVGDGYKTNIDNTYVFADSNKLLVLDPQFNEVRKLSKTDFKNAQNICFDGEWVYYSNYSEENSKTIGNIIRKNIHTGKKEMIYNNYVINMQLYNRRLYAYSFTDNMLVSMDTDGKNQIKYSITKNVDNEPLPGFCLWNDRILYINGTTLYSMNLKGKDNKIISDNEVVELYVYGDYAFIISGKSSYRKYYLINLTDNTSKQVTFNETASYYLVYKNQIIYVSGQTLYSFDYLTQKNTTIGNVGEDYRIIKASDTTVFLQGDTYEYKSVNIADGKIKSYK